MRLKIRRKIPGPTDDAPVFRSHPKKARRLANETASAATAANLTTARGAVGVAAGAIPQKTPDRQSPKNPDQAAKMRCIRMDA